MEMIPVISSNIEAIGYDEKTETVRVEFKIHSIYEYTRVPKEIYKQLHNAESIGSYLKTFISGVYHCTKIK